MANTAKTLLEMKGYEAYIAGFPGEDHLFVAVFVNGSWWVLDPGYRCCHAYPWLNVLGIGYGR